MCLICLTNYTVHQPRPWHLATGASSLPPDPSPRPSLLPQSVLYLAVCAPSVISQLLQQHCHTQLCPHAVSHLRGTVCTYSVSLLLCVRVLKKCSLFLTIQSTPYQPLSTVEQNVYAPVSYNILFFNVLFILLYARYTGSCFTSPTSRHLQLTLNFISDSIECARPRPVVPQTTARH